MYSRLGAALVVETGIVVSVESYNRCFLQHQVKKSRLSHHQQVYTLGCLLTSCVTSYVKIGFYDI